jgi:hypothetical protein
MGTPRTGADARAKIRERVRKLLGFTLEKGATEAEALSAAKLAADLMAEHDLTYESVEAVKAERYGARRQQMGCSSGLVTVVGRLFGCRGWRDGDLAVYFGTEADTDAAHRMRGMLCLAIESEWQAYLRSPAMRRSRLNARSLRASFMDAMKVRLGERLEAIGRARETTSRQAAESSGRALVLLTKGEEVARRFATYAAEHDVQLRSGGRKRIHSRSRSAAAAGYAAGSRVDLDGAAISGGIRLIGR